MGQPIERGKMLFWEWNKSWNKSKTNHSCKLVVYCDRMILYCCSFSFFESKIIKLWKLSTFHFSDLYFEKWNCKGKHVKSVWKKIYKINLQVITYVCIEIAVFCLTFYVLCLCFLSLCFVFWVFFLPECSYDWRNMTKERHEDFFEIH